jgi:GDP-D-mannose dehydratase
LHVCDAVAVAELFASAWLETMFHLAPHVDVRFSFEDPAGDATSNVIGAINVLEAARTIGASAW